MGCSVSRQESIVTKITDDPFSLSTVKPSPVPATAKSRFLSTPLVHHPPLRKGDTHHLVSLTSTTYGSLVLVDTYPSAAPDTSPPLLAKYDDPSSPDSVINTWELMEGLDDEGDLQSGNPLKLDSLNFDHFSSTQKRPNSRFEQSCGDSVKNLCDSYVFVNMPSEIEPEKRTANNAISSTKPLWKHLSEETLLSKMDPVVDSSYQRALSSRQMGDSQHRSIKSMGSSPLVSSTTTFEVSHSVGSSPFIKNNLSNDNACRIPGCEEKIVLYFTSLRGIRRTYEDCCAVRMILRGFQVNVDERDISMDSSYRKELQSAMGGKTVSLPRLFIGGKHVGDADVIRRMHDDGELAKILDGFPVRDSRVGVCERCGDARFVLCLNCNGSKRVFREGEDQMKRCSECNENGLVRCPGCS